MVRAKVLVLMTSPLDKIVHALRVVESIKRQLPGLEITWVVRRVYEPMVASFDFVDHTIVFQRSEAILKFAALIKQIRRERYDYVFDLEGHARSGAMCFFARANRKIGLKTAKEGAAVSYSEVIALPAGGGSHMIEQLQVFGSVFGVGAQVAERLPLAQGVEIPEELSAGNLRRVCLFPGRFKRERAWGGMIDLAGELVKRHRDVEVLILGVVPDVIEKPLPERVSDYQEQLSWGQICRLLAESDLVVANDNGPAQLAGALGCRNLTLYSYVSPEARGSYPLGGEGNGVIRAPDGQVSRLDPAKVHLEVEKLLAP